jgi:hypothetical protein
MKRDFIEQEMEKNFIEEALKRSFKAMRKQSTHLLKCEKCFNKYIEIIQCMADSEKKGVKK